MAIGIEREGDGCVPHGQEQRFEIYVTLYRKRRVCVAYVVKPYFQTVDLGNQVLEVHIQRLQPDEHTVVTGEDHIVLVVPGVADERLDVQSEFDLI